MSDFQSGARRLSHGASSTAIAALLKKGAPKVGSLIAVLVSLISAPSLIGVLGAALAVTMILIAAIDKETFVIPDWLNVVGFGLGLVHAAAQESSDIIWAVMTASMRASLIALLFLLLRVCYSRIRGREGIGLGDVKLACVAGAWLDWSFLPVAIELAAFTALFAYILRQRMGGRSAVLSHRIPFGLFFAPAIWMTWLIETIVD
jgi:leader peptidase (prepilin peptidase)/N-methyltransferase